MLHDGKRDGEALERLPDRVSYVLAYLYHLLHRVTSRRRLHGGRAEHPQCIKQ
jgi:hypothetical protein